ncbi:post-GPI attachment to proteins factor 2-like [Mya arenaria]|uniref:post-GPI attachment to proteins factor 2-like n=1 Tax=Mya arenaria TaxID=6604 RepID=UPI0022E70AAB|nr:post-GPI attachment to proteins factor 2-like [Mya arenaria]
MICLPLRILGRIAIGFPLFGISFAIVWSILFDFEASNRTACKVPNLLPTLSSAIGGFTPQRYIWRFCISMQTGLRFLLAFCYYHWHHRVQVGSKQLLYNRLVTLAITCHVLENLALVTLTAISSTENGEIHEYSFVMFMICSQLYMILSCVLIKWTYNVGVVTPTAEDKAWLIRKVFLQVFNLAIFFISIYFYFRHNSYCEPYIYSYFALCEYLTILSNIAFHSICCVDFHMYSFTLVHVEDIVSGRFKNS